MHRLTLPHSRNVRQILLPHTTILMMGIRIHFRCETQQLHVFTQPSDPFISRLVHKTLPDEQKLE